MTQFPPIRLSAEVTNLLSYIENLGYSVSLGSRLDDGLAGGGFVEMRAVFWGVEPKDFIARVEEPPSEDADYRCALELARMVGIRFRTA